MKTEWIKYRKIVSAYYRSANAYTALCRRENLSSAGMSPAEVQIIEHLIEYGNENRNMKWFAAQLGISTSAFTNHVNSLSRKGLVEKYHTEDNRKNIILKVSDAGFAAYEEYSQVMKDVFVPMFEILDKMSAEEHDRIVELLDVWAAQHLIGTEKNKSFTLVPVDR